MWWAVPAIVAVIAFGYFAPGLPFADARVGQWAGLGLAVIGLATGAVLFRRMNRRLMRLAGVARAIGDGDYGARSDDQSGDAIGLLGRTLNRMGDEIQAAIGDLARQHADLQSSRAQLQAGNRELAAQYRIQELFGDYLAGLNAVDINALAERLVRTVEQVCEVEFVLVYVDDAERGRLAPVAQAGLDANLTHALAGAAEEGLARRVLRSGRVHRLANVEVEQFPKADIGLGRVALGGVLAMPVTFQQRPLGVVLVASVHPLRDDIETTLRRHVDAFANALNNAISYKTVQEQSVRLEQVNLELVEADRMRSEFVANMSHELRTPLNSIIGFSGILEKNRDGVLGERELGYAEKIHRNGKHLLGLINDILDLSKIESGRMELEIDTTSAAALVSELVDMMQVQAESRGLALSTRIEDDLPGLKADAHKLKQVLINLVGNAIKFTERGEVTVAARLDPDDGSRMLFEVSDTGIGIEEDKLDHIFEAFRQVDSGTTRRYGGTGLGLAISRAFVERMAGRLTVRSTPGAGSTFTIALPLAGPHADQHAAATTEATPPRPSATVPTGGRRVLVVDDDPDARDLLSSYLTDAGIETMRAADGEQAIEMARLHHPDLITLDLMMPGLSGWEVLARLKQEEALADIPVVVISIVAETRKAAVLGAVDAITKPVSAEALQQVVARSLDKHVDGHRARVLVVDDEADARELLATMLGDHVGEIRAAGDGREALAILEQWPADLVILDLMMPVMDGLSFLRVLRADRRFDGLPVVILTARQLSESERRELASRVAAVVQKGEESLSEKILGIIQRAT